MSDSKVYMFPESGYDRGTDTALLASTLANQNKGTDPMAMMAMANGGLGGQWNNPFIYLVWMMFANRFFGNGWGESGNGLETQAQLSAIREQMNSNQNSNLLMDAIKGNNIAIGQLASQLNCDFNTLNSAICDVRGGIDKVAGQVGFSAERVINAINAGDCAISRQLSECCCNIRDAITRQGYENQLATLNQTNVLQGAINTLSTGVERGFASTAYETASQTCELKNAIAAQTQVINDKFCQLEMREMAREIQQLRDERNAYQLSASQQAQTQNLVNQLRPCPIPAYITCNPFGCQGDNYPYNYQGGCGC